MFILAKLILIKLKYQSLLWLYFLIHFIKLQMLINSDPYHETANYFLFVSDHY